MVVLSQPSLENFSDIKTCNNKPTTQSLSNEIPVINLKTPQANSLIVKACEDYGFFKAVNHGVPLNLMNNLETEALKFFQLPQFEKDKAGPPNPFGYGNKLIGPNGDVGWVEYLLFSLSVDSVASPQKFSSQTFRTAVDEYVADVKNVACEVLEMISDELKIGKTVLSRLLKDEKSDSTFRLNHYPPCPEMIQHQAMTDNKKLIGFGEHTDPQIMSVLRSNNTYGLQILLKNDGGWVSVPPDDNSFFIIVGDSLQVMTNGRFESVKHRVLAGSKKSRVSMVYFGGPPLDEIIAPLKTLIAHEDGHEEESLYDEFTWSDYKNSAYNTRLADNRLLLFQRSH